MRAYILLPDGSTRLFAVDDPPPRIMEFALLLPMRFDARVNINDAVPLPPTIFCRLDRIQVDPAGVPTAHYNPERAS